MTTGQLTSRQQHALDAGARILDRVLGSPRHGWLVDSETKRGVEYSVTPQYRCTCPAGLAGAPCKHAAACWRLAHNLGAARITLVAQDAPRTHQDANLTASPHDGVYQRVSHRTPDLGGEDDGFSLAEMLAGMRAA